MFFVLTKNPSGCDNYWKLSYWKLTQTQTLTYTVLYDLRLGV